MHNLCTCAPWSQHWKTENVRILKEIFIKWDELEGKNQYAVIIDADTSNGKISTFWGKKSGE